jgi:ubiquitin carboxyl-terminal hydrolase 14
MNASVQALRAIPELQVALSAYVHITQSPPQSCSLTRKSASSPALQSDTPLPGALRDLYASMSRTTDNITPVGFLQVLRQVCAYTLSLHT